MKFNRERLITAIDENLQLARDNHDKLVQRYESLKKERYDEWMIKYAQAWVDFASKITAGIEQGYPVTQDTLPKNDDRYGDRAAFYHENGHNSPRNPGMYTDDGEMLVLKRLLQSVDDEFVTPNQLKNLGFTSATLRNVLQRMSQVETVASRGN